MYDVQKNIFSIAKSNISKAQCRYKSDYDKKHCKTLHLLMSDYDTLLNGTWVTDNIVNAGQIYQHES